MARGEVRFKLVAETDQAKRALDELSSQVSKLGGSFASNLGPAGSVLQSLGPAGLAAAAGIGALTAGITAASAFIVDSTKKAVAYGGAIQDFADSSEIGAEALQKLAAQGLSSSTSLESITAAAKKLQVALAKSPEQFAQLGLSAEKLKQMKPDEALRAAAGAIAQLGTQSEKTAASVALLGKGFDLKFLKSIADDSVADRAVKLGQVMSQDMVSGLDAVGDEATQLSATWEHLILNFGAAVASSPEVMEALKGITEMGGQLSTWVLDNQATIKNWAGAFITEVKLVIQAVEALVYAAGKLPGAGSVKKAGAYLFGGGLDRDLVGHEMYDAAKRVEKNGSGPRSRNALDIAASGWSTHADLMAHGTGSGLSQGGGKRPTFNANAAADASKAAAAIKQAEAAQMAWWKVQEEQKDTQAEAAVTLSNWLQQLAGPSAAATEGELFKIGDAFSENIAEGVTFSTAQLDKLRAKLIELRKVSPEAFDKAVEGNAGIGQILSMSANNPSNFVQTTGPESYVARTEMRQEKERAAALAAEEFRRNLESAGQSLEQFGASIGGLVGGIAKLAGGLASAFSSQNYGSALSGAKGAKLSGAASALGAIGDIYANNKHNMSAAGGAASGAASGAKAGAAFGPYGVVIGGVVGGLVGLFSGSKFRDMAKTAGKVLGVEMTKELAEAIDATKKKLNVGTKEAALLNISGAIGDKDPRQFSKQIIELMQGIKDGSIPAKEGLEELAKDFGAVADAALKAGSIGDKSLVSILKAARAAGQETPEMKAFVAQQLGSAAGGVGGMVGGLKINTQQDAEAQGVIFSTTFWATVKEQGITGAADAFKDSFAKLGESLSAGGFDISGILGPISQIMGLAGNDLFRGAADGAKGLQAALEGVANAGYLTDDAFVAFEEQAKAAFDQAVAGGASSAQALQTIAPLLQSIQSTAGNYGETLNDQTAALIAQAKEAGVAFKSDPIDRMADSLDRAVVALEKMAGITGTVASNLSSIGNTNFGGPTTGEGVPGMADGGYVPPRPGGTLVRIGEGGRGETVVPDGKAMGGTNVTNNFMVQVDATGGDPEFICRQVVKGLRDGIAQIDLAVRSAAAA